MVISPVFHRDCAILHPLFMPSAFMSRLLQLSASLALASAALLAALPAANAHVGHGDEFQQQGDVRQVKANADTDALLGVMAEKPQQGPDGLTVPTAAVVDADGKPLVFVKSGSTYDPVFVETGATSGDRVTITTGVDATEQVVVQGALSLYAESKKSQQTDTAQPVNGPVAPSEGSSPQPTAAVSPKPQLNTFGIGAAAVGVLALGGVALTRLGRQSK
jgi:cation efflux system membrane fusion protein